MIYRIDYPPRADISYAAERLYNEGADLDDTIEVYWNGVLIRTALLWFVLERTGL